MPALDLNKLKNIKLTKEQQQYAAVSVLLLGLGIYGYWTYVLVPFASQIKTLENSLKEKKESIESARKLKDKWEEYTQRLSRVQAGLAFMARRLPPAQGVDLGLSKLVRMSTEGGVVLVAIGGDSDATRTKSEYEGYKKSVTNFWFAGDYHQLGAFLAKLSGEDLIYLAEDLVMIGMQGSFVDKFHLSSAVQLKLITYAELLPEGK